MPSYKRFLTNSVIAVLLVVFTGIAGAQTNEYYDSSGAPTARSPLSSATIRIEFDSIEAGFVKLPTLAANENKPIFVNSGGTAMEAKSVADANTLLGTELTSHKDASGGYAGLTLFKINFKNALNTVTSFFTNANTTARTYTFQDRDGIIADNTDLTLKADIASPTFTGAPSVPTAANGTDTTQIASTEFVQNAVEVVDEGIGIGQTQTNMAGKVLGDVYQNTLEKPIQVSVTVSSSASAGFAQLLVSPDTNIPTFAVSEVSFPAGTGRRGSVSAIVPPGHYYLVTSSNVTLYKWVELR